MSKTTGFLYILSYDNGTVVVTVSLDDTDSRNQYRALLIAALYQQGYAPIAVGNSVSFELSKANVTRGPGIGRAIDTVGKALGGSSYVVTFTDYQSQEMGLQPANSPGDGTHFRSERFRIEAEGVDLKRYSVVEVDTDIDGAGDYSEYNSGPKGVH